MSRVKRITTRITLGDAIKTKYGRGILYYKSNSVKTQIFIKRWFKWKLYKTYYKSDVSFCIPGVNTKTPYPPSSSKDTNEYYNKFLVFE